MRKYIRGRKEIILPKDMKAEVKEIINISTSTNDVGILTKYSEEDLNDARLYLRKNDLRRKLQSRIDVEIKTRIELRRKPSKPSSSLTQWFPEKWEAVRALFGKGTMDINDKKTAEILESIDLEWANNIKG